MSNIIWHQLPADVSRLICKYVGSDRIKPWVKALCPIDYFHLSSNPNALHLIKDNLDKIDWLWLSSNPSAIDLLKANPDKIDWNWLSMNPNPSVMNLLLVNPDKIKWIYIKKTQELYLC
jgi:hypothetical protein